ncbi:hypothetical protein [Flavobacterium laiguense]|uniref:Uncharacterized protein n=1 Tax=Flavobacterium laiguense TaxID=2169409 RepID=A0A2U1JWD7_9FLAO|nr:hypothetical protein [Flavobacterium laiguense]PWA09521.1 hypothetical protein DB891_07510 [Flavobacterium laiguense]
MNKEVVTIGGAVLGGMVSNGVSTLLPQNPNSGFINAVIAGVSVFGATKVSGTGTKENLLRGALMGSALAQVSIILKKAGTKYYAQKPEATSKADLFTKGVLGLGCPDEGGLHGGLMGADGNVYEYDESGLHGTFMDENGNVFEQADGLHGAEEEIYGLQGAEDELYGLQGEYDGEY